VFNSSNIAPAVREIFEFMIGMDLTVHADSSPLPKYHQHSVSGVVGFSGPIRGMVAIHFPEQVALAVTSALLGTEETTITEDVRDAMGEVANMVAGGIKTVATEQGMELDLSIPTTVCGERYAVGGFPSATRTAAEFSIQDGNFFVEIRYVG
jgi:chemotaxis protein CheX